MVKTEIKAKTKIINANFFHIKDPSFQIIFSTLTYLDGGNGGFIQNGILEKWNEGIIE
jgi:hypothetical protein